ncbi:MAG TPA: hypothetical protein VGX68_03755 [Thermoanaerobaculia bacterium]|jgi:hypothetical protein|nr:hypothetical protein [Thermoanaerobaculia bacterium]
MRGFLAVFERELVERRLLAAAALLLGLVPLTTPLLPGTGQRGGPEVRNATALALALCFSFGLALLLGASIIARDLAERRLGFYFSRPIGGWAVWSGKLAAAFVLALSVGVLILLPATAIDRRFDLGGLLSARLIPFGTFPSVALSALLWVATVLLLVLLSHAAGVALRSRSPWLLLDFAGLGLVGWLASAAARRLIFVGALGAAAVATAGLLVAGLLALIAGGANQVLGGRTDLRRGHRLQSLTLWGTLLTASLLAQGYASWVLAAEPEDLDKVYIAAGASRGPWISITGAAAHRAEYQPDFLLNVSSGRFVRLQTPRSFWAPPRFSADGRWAAWLEPREGALRPGPSELVRLDLRDPRSQPERTGITYSQPFPTLALSADGGRVAVAAGGRLTLEEVPSGRLLASAELPRELFRYEDSLRFVDSNRVQILGGDLFSKDAAINEPGPFEVAELKAGGGLVRIARIEQVADPRVSGDGTRILARRRSDQRWLVFDAGTGAVLAELPAAGDRSKGAFLADGRMAIVTGAREKELQIFSPAFVPERTFRFKTAMAVRLGGQPAPDRLVVATAPRGPEASRWDLSRTMLLDLATGSVRRLGIGMLPVTGPHCGPESIASRLLQRGEDRLVQFDPETGKQTVIAGRRSG